MNAAVLLGVLLAEAPPATVPPPPPRPAPIAPAASPDADPPHRVGVSACLSYRLSPRENQLTPTAGLSVGGQYQWRYQRLVSSQGPSLQLAVAGSFFYARFSTVVEGTTVRVSGVEELFRGNRVISQTGFAASQVVSLAIAPLRLWLSAGAGLTLGYFSSPERDLRPGSMSSRQPLLTGGAGLAIAVNANTEVAAHVDLVHPLTHPTFTPTVGPALALFGDLLDIGVGLFYRF